MRAVPQLSRFVHERYLPYVRTYKNSWQTDETVLRIHILPKLGALALDEIRTDAIADLINAMRADGYASGTINRVIVILRYIYNLARKWKTPGGVENPAAGLSAGPDVQRNRFLSEQEAEALVRSIHIDQNQTAARAIMLLLLTGARRNEITFAKWDYVDWKNKTLLVPKSKSGRARVIALNQPAIALLTAAPRIEGNPFYFPVSGQWPAVGLTLFSLGSYPKARRPHRCSPARSASFFCELSGQSGRVALCRARSPRPPACADDAALRAPHAGNSDRRR
jgi:integrase